MSTEAPTIAERYSLAVSSSNLKSEAHRRGPVDLLIAAGWSDSLGVSLYRLQGEYDTAAREIARMSNKTDAILAMSKLKSLTSTRVQLVRFATEAAKRWRVNLEPQVIGILAGSRPGDIVLDPFMGSGTTAAVALQHYRRYLGCELNPEYGRLQDERIRGASRWANDNAAPTTRDLFNEAAA